MSAPKMRIARAKSEELQEIFWHLTRAVCAVRDRNTLMIECATKYAECDDSRDRQLLLVVHDDCDITDADDDWDDEIYRRGIRRDEDEFGAVKAPRHFSARRVKCDALRTQTTKSPIRIPMRLCIAKA